MIETASSRTERGASASNRMCSFIHLVFISQFGLREQDLNLRPSGYEPDELPGCSIPRGCDAASRAVRGATGAGASGPGHRTDPRHRAAVPAPCGAGGVASLTRRRPTVPRLETQYHGRWGLSRPSSGWDRVLIPPPWPPGRRSHAAAPPGVGGGRRGALGSWCARAGALACVCVPRFDPARRPPRPRGAWMAAAHGASGRSGQRAPRPPVSSRSGD